MQVLGHMLFVGGGMLKAGRLENLTANPSSPYAGQIWFDTTVPAIKYYNGTSVEQIAVGNSLSDYLALAGGTMLGSLILAGAPTQDLEAATKKYVDDGLALKENNLTGAATSIAHTNLTASMAVVSDSSGKVAASVTTAAELAYVHGVTSAVQAQIDGKEPTIGYTTVNKAGDTMGGNLAFAGTYTATGLAAPVNNTDAVRYIDLQTALAGLDIQPDVLDTQTDNSLDPTATPATGDRYIITDAANLNANFGTIAGVEDNDIVQYNGTSWYVAYDVSVKGAGALAWDRAAVYWQRYDGTDWANFGGLAGVTDGVGLVKSGNVISVNMGAGITQLPTDEVGVDLYNDGSLQLVDPTSGLTSSANNAQLGIKLTGSTLNTSSAGLKVAVGGITPTELNASVIADGLQGSAGTAISVKAANGINVSSSGVAAVAYNGISVDGNGIGVVADTGISVTATGVAVDVTWADNRYVNTSGDTLTGDLILSGNTSNALGAITKQYVDSATSNLGTTVSDLTTRMEGCFLVFTNSTPATSFQVNHNLGTKFVNVTVVDSSDNVIIPDSVVYNSTTQLTVTFSSAIACTVVVAGLKV